MTIPPPVTPRFPALAAFAGLLARGLTVLRKQPAGAVAMEKIALGTIQGLLAALVIFPLAILIPACRASVPIGQVAQVSAGQAQVAGMGTGSSVQVRPFHHWPIATVVLGIAWPTAMQPPAAQETPLNEAVCAPAGSRGARGAHEPRSSNLAAGWVRPAEATLPTPTQVEARHARPARVVAPWPGEALLASRRQVVPSQVSVITDRLALSTAYPIAVHAAGALHDSATSTLLVAPPGPLTRRVDQVLPFQNDATALAADMAPLAWSRMAPTAAQDVAVAQDTLLR